MDTFLEVVHLPFKLAIAFQLESNQFKSYFKSGIQILEGGVASGLNHVNINDKTPKLFIVKGKRQPMIRDLFILASFY